MIQELFGGSSVSILGGDSHRSSNLSSQLLEHSSSPSPSPSPSSSTVSATATATTAPPPAQNLRCPRCDSANTKFCYYNNYNLTQPRHFCKTCRRYWTKGGALRNVPIGGGCRKNKTTTITSSASKSSHTPGKFIKTELGKSALFNGFEQLDLSPNPLLWPTTQNSHLLSLLRTNPNPNHMTNNHMSLKEEGPLFGQSYFTSSTSTGLSERSSLGFDSLGQVQVPSIGLGNSYYRSNQGILLGEAEGYNGLQELYQRLRSSSTSTTTSCFPDHAPVILGHVATSSNSTTILDSAPVASGGGLLNPSLYWQNDMQTTNGAYP